LHQKPKRWPVLAVFALVLLASFPVLGEAPAAPTAAPVPAVQAPAIAEPLSGESEGLFGDLPNLTPAPEPQAKACEVNYDLRSDPYDCDYWCSLKGNCYGVCTEAEWPWYGCWCQCYTNQY